ncbi:TIGR02099 family protein [Alteromonas aestuariivivens]|uniref:TIGR02099 family protein n=1 Tax=Alteromonas aestuariivivens TaxID=1938339 RepID=A0A3D8M7C9_9ALTE|nr:YhdP family protein [Alteromonas aestuariivivens]RDV25560.1 TIGR02099 family protein [Alteromonas aestuariivivens]
MTKAFNVAAYLVKKLWLLFAILLVLFAVMLSVMRYALPHLDQKKYLLEDYVNQRYGVHLGIGSVRADWKNNGPSIVLDGVTLEQDASSPVELQIERIYIEVDFWKSVARRMVSSDRFDLEGVVLDIDTDRMKGGGDSSYPVVDALKSLFLEQLQSFSLQQGEVRLSSSGKKQVLELETLSWSNRGRSHQGQGALRVKELANNSASFVIDLTGNKDNLAGVFYAKAEELDISPWVSGLINTSRPLTSSRANFETWIELESGSVSAWFANFQDSSLEWGGEHSPAVLTGIKGGSIQALPSESGWNFRVDQLIFGTNDQSIVTDLVGRRSSDGAIVINTVKPIPVNPLLVLLPIMTDDASDDDARGLNPRGQLATLQFRWKGGQPSVAAKLIDLSWQQQGLMPGVDSLDMDFYWHGNQGTIALRADEARLTIDNLLPQNSQIDKLRGKVFVYQQQGDWVIQANQLRVESPLVSLKQAFRFQQADRALSLYTEIEDLAVADVHKLLPAPLMGQKTSDYLTRAFVGPGRIEGVRLLWQGTGADFPFHDNTGVFQAYANVTDSSFLFSPDWPALTEFDVQLKFENDNLTMFSPGGKLMGVEVTDMTAAIPGLKGSSVLTIEAMGQGRGEQVADLMMNSGIRNSLGKVLKEEVRVSGDLEARLKLEIPLNGKPVVASGTAELAGNQVDITRVDIHLDRATGKVDFINDIISTRGFTANLLEQPVALQLNGSKQGQSYEVAVGLSGDWDVTPLVRQYKPTYERYLSGNSAWQAEVKVSLLEQGFEYQADIRSQLNGLYSTLPSPLAKAQGQPIALVVSGKGNQQASTIVASLGDTIRFDGVLPHREMQFSRAHLAFGESDFVGRGMGFSISADLNVVNVGDWYQAIDLLLVGINKDTKGLFSSPERIFIDTDNLVFAGQTLSDVSVTAKQLNQNWSLNINSQQARATVNLYDQWLQRGIEIEADFVRFDEWNSNASDDVHDWNADRLPPLYFHCGQCSVYGKNLGEVTLDVARSEQGMEIRQFKAKSQHGELSASGQWRFGESLNSTRIAGVLSSNDVGMMLQSYGVNAGIKDSGAQLDFDLAWPLSPMDFALQDLAGTVTWELSDGYLSEVSDKGSRIFSLFSLNSLVRKLSLDFRDVFAKGFFYDKMSGTLQISDGRAYTDDSEIDGAAGEIVIDGYTDLVAQQLNYDVTFTPNVTGNLPFLVYFLATPQTALAALAIDQVLTSAKVISNVNYRVTGTINDPTFEEVGRDSKDIALPARAQPEPTAPDSQPLTQPDLEPLHMEIING